MAPPRFAPPSRVPRGGRAAHPDGGAEVGGVGCDDGDGWVAPPLPASAPRSVPAYDGGNTTGFASPASDALEGPVDLAEALDLRRPQHYPVRVLGDALEGRGIRHGDVLVVDAAAPLAHGRVAVVMVHGEAWVAELAWRDGGWWMRPGRGAKPAVPLGAGTGEDAEVWGVVRSLVRLRV